MDVQTDIYLRHKASIGKKTKNLKMFCVLK